VIKSFRHKGLERFFISGSMRGIDARHAGKLRRMLAALHTAGSPTDLSEPAYRTRPLSGDRRGQWSMWVSGNWRIVFEFDGTDVIDVDLVDYH
jgi:toxin HigB-1